MIWNDLVKRLGNDPVKALRWTGLEGGDGTSLDAGSGMYY